MSAPFVSQPVAERKDAEAFQRAGLPLRPLYRWARLGSRDFSATARKQLAAKHLQGRIFRGAIGHGCSCPANFGLNLAPPNVKSKMRDGNE